jgi:uncharacterized membrane protein YbhN (UPF0104 family)
MSPSLRKALYWIGILLGGSLFFIQVWRGNQSLTSKSIVFANPSGLVLSALFMFSAMGLQMAAWRMLMANLGVGLVWREVLENYVLSFMPRYIPGSFWGYVSRAEWLKQKHDIPYSVSNLGSILEIALIFMGISLVTAVYLFQTPSENNKWLLLALFCSLPLIGWVVIKWVLTSSKLNNLLGKFSVPTPVKFIPFGIWLELSTLHAIAWAFYGASVLWITRSFSPDISVSLINTTFLFAISWTLGFIVIFVPSGLGIREQSLSMLLISLKFLSPDEASGVAVLSRLFALFGEMVWLLIGLVIKRLHT